MKKPILEVKKLQVSFAKEEHQITVVNGVSFVVHSGETLGIVGESGCGKSITSLSIMGLIPRPPGRISGGQIIYNHMDLTQLSEEEMRDIRGNEISMIFQEPMTSLNPVFTIGRQIDEIILLHTSASRQEAKQMSIEMLERVGISRAEQIYHSYPFELSGGMRQRVMIAIGMACQPKLLIADEPTTALDVTIQLQILDLMKNLQAKENTAIMLITHDLGVVAEMCDRVLVMYAGEVVEEADVDDLFHDPKHPYTIGLLLSIPSTEEKKSRLYSIKGQVPPAGTITRGCRFAERCERVFDRCLEEDPEIVKVAENHTCRCWLYA
ncbi:dipeptide/oligopeptide/nickel ABC transporter ATP-binding protein [Brevibacillus reuszeri]|uniref:Dipeptide/oligopeptide/nickel ABC transporter ATP-binding protein n=1 Tax=Brevibacillus reuszeri TaxID=54915 RepID=A0A0K9YL85_9BACL|nr:ABC transporter ATP-binding protein [Brevibacillus reuszeri]KNB69422.1 peptide ABC transporter ATP-binding protein [Brevibacillus reuszeri]MED1860258.1 ABC transporter ATP-binding protein [Brevibacillus reuszeri]GED70853.1 dipeptide/oligopeptide/nickel ABC transporter ATP-binding protein [Brevibacillus reuszeri]